MTSRNIPVNIKKIVRKKCGFGCVICGGAVYEYHHIDYFSKSKKHPADQITLLCPKCHSEAHKGLISFDAIKEANGDPWCQQN